MKILLATDGSDTARAAVGFLMTFPFPAPREVVVISVVQPALGGDEVEGLTTDRRESFEVSHREEFEEAGRMAEAERTRLSGAGWEGSTLVRVGDPAEEINHAAEELGADMVVVGSHGLSGIKKFLLGSVSDHVLRSAPCSVLIVKNLDMQRFAEAKTASPAAERPWRILLAYDGSDCSRKALALCAAFPLGDAAEVKALTVLPLIKMFRQDIRQQMNWVWQEKKKTARQELEAVKTALTAATPNVSSELVESPSVAEAVLDAEKDFHSDLVVIGHKGKSAAKKLLLGSVTSRIAHHSACSVLAVREDSSC